MLVFGSDRGRYVSTYKNQSGPYEITTRVGNQGRQNMYRQLFFLNHAMIPGPTDMFQRLSPLTCYTSVFGKQEAYAN